MICDRVFERFPNLRMASIENGSGYLSGLFTRLRGLDRKLPGHFSQDPVETFLRHIWISPFWEERIEDVIELVGPDRVVFGSDWPHVEGLPAAHASTSTRSNALDDECAPSTGA